MFDEKLVSIANTLVGYCREDAAEKGLDTLYAPDAVSVEAADMGGGGVVTEGLDAIRGKHEWWRNNFDVHDSAVEGPFLHGENRFGAIFSIDATNKQTGERSAMKELGLYTVDNGKIVREEFYYAASA